MKKTKKGIAVLLLVAILFNMSITSVFAAETSEPKVYTKETKTLTLNEDFSANGCDGAIYAHDDANLTINGTGKVHGELCGKEHDPENKPGELCGYAMAVWAKNNTKITINGGTYTNDKDTVSNDKTHVDLIYASNGSEITITGGTFKCSTPKWTLNCKDEKNTAEEVVLPSTITVTGGTFYQFDPSKAEVGEGEVIVPEGYRVVKNEDWYTVYKENTITVQEVEGGTVSVIPAKAIIGETVGLTIKANEGYEIDNVTVIDSNGDTVTVTNNEFVMPDSAVTVTAKFIKIIDYITSGNETENNKIGVVESETITETLDTSLKADTELNKKVDEERKKGNQVIIEITMEELEKDAVKEEVKQQILQTVAESQTVHQYFDISVLVRTNEKELGKLTQLTEKMKFSMEISKDLIKEGRKFYIINLHDDEVRKIDATLDGTKLEFETDKFSTFALAYEDSAPVEQQPETDEKDDTPKTGVINIPVYVWASIAGMALIGIVTTKKHSKHSK